MPSAMNSVSTDTLNLHESPLKENGLRTERCVKHTVMLESIIVFLKKIYKSRDHPRELKLWVSMHRHIKPLAKQRTPTFIHRMGIDCREILRHVPRNGGGCGVDPTPICTFLHHTGIEDQIPNRSPFKMTAPRPCATLIL